MSPSEIAAALSEAQAGKPGHLAQLGLQLLRKVSSTGRLAFVALMVVALIMWSPLAGGSQEIPSTMQTVLLAVMGYLLGGKGVSAWRAGRDG